MIPTFWNMIYHIYLSETTMQPRSLLPFKPHLYNISSRIMKHHRTIMYNPLQSSCSLLSYANIPLDHLRLFDSSAQTSELPHMFFRCKGMSTACLAIHWEWYDIGMTLSCPFNLFLFSCRVCDSEKFESQTTMHVQKTGATWHKMLQKWRWCVAWVAWMDSNVFPTRHSRHASRVWMLERCPTLGWSVPVDVAKTLKTLKTRYFLPYRCLQILRAFAVLLLLQSVLEYTWSILKLHLAD